MRSMGEELHRLMELHSKGYLTLQEFEAQKASLLSGLDAAVTDAVGAYRILGHIGAGGMGAVYRARHRAEARAVEQGGDVALKVMHERFAQQPEFRQRFEREATLGMTLRHPGIVRVFDLVVDAGRLALVMELVQGQGLSERIGTVTGPIPWTTAGPLFGRLLEAVATAHAAGVVHRDLKPENVLVTPEGLPRILDFGIARLADSSQTRTGAGVGTVDYMAPEQYVDASSVDCRADIYALGMTLYEIVAGRLPWEPGVTQFSVLDRKRTGDLPPPTDFYPDIPPHVVDAIERATSVDADDRFEDVEALAEALEIDGLDLHAAPWPAPPPSTGTVLCQPPAARPLPAVPAVTPPRPTMPAAAAPPPHPPAARGRGWFAGLVVLALVAGIGGVGAVLLGGETDSSIIDVFEPLPRYCEDGLGIWINVDRTKADGRAWDPFDGAPDPFGQVTLTLPDGTILTEQIHQRTDTRYLAGWFFRGERIPWEPGLALNGLVSDMDASANDLVGHIEGRLEGDADEFELTGGQATGVVRCHVPENE